MGSEHAALSGPDIGVLAAYFVLIIIIGICATWRSNRTTISGYFLAGRNMWFLPIGASLFVSNIGSRHLIGLAGSGAASGISVAAWEFNVYTMPEYLSRRYGGQRLRVYFACLSLLMNIISKCSGALFAGGLFMQQALNWDIYLSICTLIVVTAAVTVTGGLTGVIYTDTLQALLILGGSTYLTIAAFAEIGGFSGLLEKYPQAVPTNVSAIVVNTTCHWPDRQAFRMLRAAHDPYMPWLGFLLGQTPAAVWYWCADQVIVQRALAAKRLSHAQGATLFAGLLKVLPLFVMVFPGMASRILYPDEVACSNPEYCYDVCQSKVGCSDIAYPRLVLGLLPEGARGLMMAVMIAALMSDLDSIFNSSSTVFTLDVWQKLRRRTSNMELMVVGRLSVLVLVVMSVAWVPIIQQIGGGQFFIYLVRMQSYLTPPVAAVFLLGIFVPMVNEKGAFWSLMLSLVAGLLRLTLRLLYDSEGICGEAVREVPGIIGNFQYMYFALFLFLLTTFVAVVISYVTQHPDSPQLSRTTFWTRHHDCEPTSTDLDVIPEGETDHARLRKGEECQPGIIQMAFKNGGTEPSFSEPEGQEGTGLSGQNLHKDCSSTCKDLVYSVCCGVQRSTEDLERNLAALEQHLKALRSLKQGRVEKAFLNIGLALTLFTGVAMYVFWSVYPFVTGPFYPKGAPYLLPGDNVSTEN